MNNKHILWLFFMLIGQVHAHSIDQRWQQAFVNQPYLMPKFQQLEQFKINIKQRLDDLHLHQDHWDMLGFKQEIKSPLLFLSELKHRQQGRGFIILRPQASQPWLLQAPHAKSDLYTGKIASRLFLEGDFKAVIWNTLPRKTRDMAHNDNSYWQAITQAFAEHYPQGKIIQLHGFSAKKREQMAAQQSDIIISAGHASPPLWVKYFADCLNAQTQLKVTLYPDQVSELGGTMNSQSQLLQRMAHTGFLHIEMNKTVRKKLLKQSMLRKQLLFCLAKPNINSSL